MHAVSSVLKVHAGLQGMCQKQRLPVAIGEIGALHIWWKVVIRATGRTFFISPAWHNRTTPAQWT